MATKEPESSQELRGRTDKSLEDERGKADALLDQKSRLVEEKTSETIRRNRVAADSERESVRAEVDLDKEHQLDAAGVETSLLDDAILNQERDRFDAAQVDERRREIASGKANGSRSG